MQINLQPIDKLEIFVLMDNISDPFSSSHPGIRWNEFQYAYEVLDKPGMSGADLCRACNGLSLLLKIHKNDTVKTILFDAGPDQGLIVDNAKRMGIDLKEIDCIVLSHGHFDHYGGLVSVLKEISKTDIPIYVHPELFLPRAFKRDKVVPVTDNITREQLSALGGKIIEHTNPQVLFDGLLCVSGEVPRITSYEEGSPVEQRFKNGKWVDSPDVIDERILFLNLKNKGLCVFTACGHTGVINAVQNAIDLSGTENIHLIMGGFHLAGKKYVDRVQPTVHDIKNFEADFVVTGHCTGRDTQMKLTQQLGDKHIAYAVGSYFAF